MKKIPTRTCIITKENNSIFHNTYPGNYTESQVNGKITGRRNFTEEDLETFHKYYQDIYGELFLPTTYNDVITSFDDNAAIAYKASTQKFWKEQAKAGKTYVEILNATGTAEVADSKLYKNKSIYKLENYCKATTSNLTNTSTNYVNWMVEFAADNSHGYSMNHRTMNPDVDCSSFVYYALLNNGYTKSQLGSYPFSTAAMENILTSIGFEKITYNENSLQEGDILWYPEGFNGHSYGHTEVYIGDGKTVGAHSNYDGITGDSSGREVSVVSVREYKSIFRKK